MDKRILVGSCGGLTGSYLVRQFKKKPGCFVVGADANENNVTRHFANDFVLLPTAKNPGFCDCLVETLIARQIDCYVPTHSQEIRAVSQHEADIRARWPGDFLVCPYNTFEKLDNKRNANKKLLMAGVPVPTLIEDCMDDISYPIFMKPNEGSGSRKAQAVESATLHREYRRLYPDAGFYQLIRGTEYTVDCMFDDSGKLLAYNQRVRIKSMGGAVIVTKNDYNFDIFPYLKKLEQAFVFKGCVNFQYILSEGIPYFTDINLRYASGGLPLTVASGIDVPQILLDIFSHRPIGNIPSCGANHRTMYRYFEELIKDER